MSQNLVDVVHPQLIKANVNALAWPNIEIDENVTLLDGRKVRTKLYLPPELRKHEITKFPMVVHV